MENHQIQFENFFTLKETYKAYDKRRKNVVLERGSSFNDRRPRNPKLKWGFDYTDLVPFLEEGKNQQYPWNWIGLQIRQQMTQSFLKTHFFRFQHKIESHKYTVSSAVQWIFKTEITQTADQNKIRFCCNI